ncbi:MAG: hypothetical protein R3F43_07680 [bacterium]
MRPFLQRRRLSLEQVAAVQDFHEALVAVGLKDYGLLVEGIQRVLDGQPPPAVPSARVGRLDPDAIQAIAALALGRGLADRRGVAGRPAVRVRRPGWTHGLPHRPAPARPRLPQQRASHPDLGRHPLAVWLTNAAAAMAPYPADAELCSTRPAA